MKSQLKQQSTKTKVITQFRPKIRSRHDSHDILRGELPRMPFRSVVRLGSETQVEGFHIECNTIEAVRNSASKLRMKHCFTNAGVTTAMWWTFSNERDLFMLNGGNDMSTLDNLPFPLITKSLHGSRGTGNSFIKTKEDFQQWIQGKNLANYIFEQYKTYSREYRLHVTKDGCFYTCRKMLKRDTPEDKKFQRHDDNCTWYVEDNPGFDKPINWDAIVADCVLALNSLGLDIGAFDLKVQSARTKDGRVNENPEWIVIESCSAPSFGEITAQKYKEKIPEILLSKFQQSRGN